jgi:outer membrane protein assembly factor BamB
MIRHRQLLLLLLCLSRLSLGAADWPTHQANYARNAVTDEPFPVERGMGLAWAWSSPQVPQPAWPQPAKWDSYKYIHGLKSMRNYDPVFHVSLGGGLVFFGSSVDDSVHALDARTGESRWVFPTEGPVRVAPTFQGGRLYFGSDDGFAYCVDATTGRPVWKFSPQPGARRVLNGGKLISFWPVRTGVVVDGEIAYFAASMLPWKRSYLCAVDAVTGSTNGPGRYVREMDNQSIEGPFAASAKHLVMPQGRVAPRVYSRSNGEDRGALGGGGGSFVLLADDNQILHGPGNLTGRMVASQVASRTQLASFDQANAIVVVGGIAYVLTDTTLSAMKRSTREAQWTVDCGYSFALIGAGETLFVGGTDAVAGYRMSDGQKVWSQPVSGRAYGLAAAGGHLLVSTDAGRIYSFSCKAATNPPSAGALAAVRPPADHVPSGRFWSPSSSWDDGIGKSADTNSTPIQDWIFHRAALHSGEEQSPLWPLRDGRLRAAGNSGLDAQLTGIANIQRVGEVYALKLDGKQNGVRVDRGLKGVPWRSEQLSVDAWIQFDRVAGELAIVGVRGLESTNAADRGWRLGAREGRLVFGLACSRTNGWVEVIATASCRSNTWHHLAGVYDGQQLRVYLDGESVGSRDVAGGEIVYPTTPNYEMARTKVGGKEVYLAGLLHRVRVQPTALATERIRARFNEERSGFHQGAPLAAGPSLQFVSPTEGIIRWLSTTPSPTVLEYDLNGHGYRFEDPALVLAHEVRLTGLRYDRIYKYSVAVRVGNSSGPPGSSSATPTSIIAPRSLGKERIRPVRRELCRGWPTWTVGCGALEGSRWCWGWRMVGISTSCADQPIIGS